MKTLVLTLFISALLLNCSKEDNLKPDNKEIWKRVFFDSMSNTDVHDPNITIL